jgi:sugar phosphate isomerase/epimerase
MNEVVIAQKSKPLYTASLGIAPYTFRKSFPNGVAATLDTIKMMGFTEIEGGGGRISPEEYKKLCDERGLSIPSFGAGYDHVVNYPDSVIWRAKIFGAKYVMVS